jgi:hypothetical protein
MVSKIRMVAAAGLVTFVVLNFANSNRFHEVAKSVLEFSFEQVTNETRRRRIDFSILPSEAKLETLRLAGFPGITNETFSHNIYNGSVNGSNTSLYSSLPRDHPHAGARYANGSWGYRADVYSVRRQIIKAYISSLQQFAPPGEAHFSKDDLVAIDSLSRREVERMVEKIPRWYLPIHSNDMMNDVCHAAPATGVEGESGWRLITEKVRVSANASPRAANVTRSRILCAPYTYDKRHEQIQAIAETWGWKCDGFLAASTKTVPEIGAVDLPHLGPETYRNLWQKTRSMLAYMHDYYLDEFDIFYVLGDDAHVILENYQHFLNSLDQQALRDYPLYTGSWCPGFIGGGSGIVLNRVSLKILNDRCLPHFRPDDMPAPEDVYLGDFFRSIDIPWNSSVDAVGAQMFHGRTPQWMATFDGINGFDWDTGLYKFWAQYWGFRAGFNVTSRRSIVFHELRTTIDIRRTHAILYRHSCPLGTPVGDALRDII